MGCWDFVLGDPVVDDGSRVDVTVVKLLDALGVHLGVVEQLTPSGFVFDGVTLDGTSQADELLDGSSWYVRDVDCSHNKVEQINVVLRTVIVRN